MKTGYIQVKNKGQIDVNSLFLLGATNKRGDATKIGFFGSGLKYAIAVLLKNNIDFKIYSGEKEIKVSTRKSKFRDVEVEIITINNKKTSLTVDMGPSWEPWFAVREVYCNAIDEGEYDITTAKTPKGEKGYTNIFIENHDLIKELFKNWDKYFSNKRVDGVCEIKNDFHSLGGNIFEGNQNELIIYRKGVQCFYDKNRKSLFHYDLPWVLINESRVLSDMSVAYTIPKMLAKGANQKMIRKIFSDYNNTYEEDLMWDLVNYFNDDWLSVINGRKIVVDLVSGYYEEEIAEGNCLILPKNLAQALKDFFKEKVFVYGTDLQDESLIEIKMTDLQAKMLTESLLFIKKGGIEIPYALKVVKFNDSNTLGSIESKGPLEENKSILISDKAFDLGFRELVMVLIEEYIHVKSGTMDKTRAMQRAIMNEMIILMEKSNNMKL